MTIFHVIKYPLDKKKSPYDFFCDLPREIIAEFHLVHGALISIPKHQRQKVLKEFLLNFEGTL